MSVVTWFGVGLVMLCVMVVRTQVLFHLGKISKRARFGNVDELTEYNQSLIFAVCCSIFWPFALPCVALWYLIKAFGWVTDLAGEKLANHLRSLDK